MFDEDDLCIRSYINGSNMKNNPLSCIFLSQGGTLLEVSLDPKDQFDVFCRHLIYDVLSQFVVFDH